MDDVIQTFPLLSLPIDAIRNNLRTMSYQQIIFVSILSKKTKNLVESLKLTATEIPVYVTDGFDIRLYFPNNSDLFFRLYQVGENKPIQEVNTPGSIIIVNGNSIVTWKNVMSVKQILDHFQFIFHISIIERLYFGRNCERFSFESIQKNVKDFQSICFPSENHEQHIRVLNFFRPATLDLLSAALIDGCVPRYILIQNFGFIRANSVQITLNDLLVTNARSITLFCHRISIKIPNRFLKLWTKGSDSRLEYLFLRFRCPGFQAEELLRGLKYQDAPPNRRRLFKVCSKKEPNKVTGGWDIWRFDGTQATILADVAGGLVRLQLFVWHDHCVIN